MAPILFPLFSCAPFPPGQSFDEFGTFHRLSEGEQHRVTVRGSGGCGCSCGEETAGGARATTGCTSHIGDETGGALDVDGVNVRPLVGSSSKSSSLGRGLGGGSDSGLLSDWLEVCKGPGGCDNSSGCGLTPARPHTCKGPGGCGDSPGSDLLSIRPVRSSHSELCFGLVFYVKGRAVLGWTVRGGTSLLGMILIQVLWGRAVLGWLGGGACRNYYFREPKVVSNGCYC